LLLILQNAADYFLSIAWQIAELLLTIMKRKQLQKKASIFKFEVEIAGYGQCRPALET
jgi:hypothetical protein